MLRRILFSGAMAKRSTAMPSENMPTRTAVGMPPNFAATQSKMRGNDEFLMTND